MKKTVIIFGTSTGTCEELAGRIGAKLGVDNIINVTDLDDSVITANDNLILGTSTWGAGELQDDWYDGVRTIGAADLSGKTVAVQLGTSGEALLAEGGDLADLAATFGNLTTCDSFLKCFTELGGGAVDAVIVDKPVAVSYAAENAGFTVLDEGLGAEQYGIAFRSGDAELCAEIEDAVAKLVENGTYAEIAAKYPDIVNNLTLLG